MVPGVWEIFRADCTVILRYCKSKSGRKCKSYCTLKHQRILNLQFAQFFKGLKRGLLTKIRCSLCLQGMVLDGLKGFQAKKSKSMTFNYKSCISYLVLAQLLERCCWFAVHLSKWKWDNLGLRGFERGKLKGTQLLRKSKACWLMSMRVNETKPKRKSVLCKLTQKILIC